MPLNMLTKIDPSLKEMISAPCGPSPSQKMPTNMTGRNIVHTQKNGINAMATLAEGQQNEATKQKPMRCQEEKRRSQKIFPPST
jgi:hypothetical protein